MPPLDIQLVFVSHLLGLLCDWDLGVMVCGSLDPFCLLAMLLLHR